MNPRHSSPFPFGVSEFTTWPWTFEQDAKAYRELGVGCIEVCEAKLDADPGRAREQLDWLKTQGLRITSVQPRLHSLFPDQPRPEPAQPSERMKRYRTTIDLFGQASPGATLVSITGAAPQGNYRHAFETAVAEYRKLAEYAADHGLRVALEPLNPILMNIDTFICTLADARRIVEAVNHPAFGLFVDVWHVFQDVSAIGQVEAIGGDRIFGAHVNDWHAAGPRHVGDRAIPGAGIIPLDRWIAALHRAGYRGAYTLEIFSVESLPDSLWRGDLRQTIDRSKRHLQQIWSQLCD